MLVDSLANLILIYGHAVAKITRNQFFEPFSVSFFQVTPLIISAMFAGDPYSKFENHEKVIRRLVGNRNPTETVTLNETRRSIHSVSGKVIRNGPGQTN